MRRNTANFLADFKVKMLLLWQKPSFQDEIEYWDHYLAANELLIFDEAIKQKAFPRVLKDEISKFRNKHHSAPQVLEVGSGPVSLLLEGVEKGDIEVKAIDPLAETYSILLQEHGIEYPIKPVLGFAENLSRHFSPSTFDFVYSSNALDHALSPGLCLRQIKRVTKPGGIIFLEGFINEGSSGDWHGLHQHDLYLEHQCLMHKSRSGKISNISSGLGLKCLLAEICQFKDREILSYGYEIPEKIRPEKNWNFRDWYMIAFQKMR